MSWTYFLLNRQHLTPSQRFSPTHKRGESCVSLQTLYFLSFHYGRFCYSLWVFLIRDYAFSTISVLSMQISHGRAFPLPFSYGTKIVSPVHQFVFAVWSCYDRLFSVVIRISFPLPPLPSLATLMLKPWKSEYKVLPGIQGWSAFCFPPAGFPYPYGMDGLKTQPLLHKQPVPCGEKWEFSVLWQGFIRWRVPAGCQTSGAGVLLLLSPSTHMYEVSEGTYSSRSRSGNTFVLLLVLVSPH